MLEEEMQAKAAAVALGAFGMTELGQDVPVLFSGTRPVS